MDDLKRLIYDKGFTIKTLAKRMGCATSTIGKIINHPRERMKQTDTFFKMARALGITESELRKMSNNPIKRNHPIVEILSERNLSMMEFAQQSGVAYDTIIGITSGRVTNPHLSTLEYIAEELGVPVERIMG